MHARGLYLHFCRMGIEHRKSCEGYMIDMIIKLKIHMTLTGYTTPVIISICEIFIFSCVNPVQSFTTQKIGCYPVGAVKEKNLAS